jgi:hypothetical protein
MKQWTWETQQDDAKQTNTVRVTGDKVEWSYYVPSGGTGSQVETVASFLERRTGYNDIPDSLLEQLTAYLQSGEWKNATHFQTLWLTVTAHPDGTRDAEIMMVGADKTPPLQYPNVDDPQLAQIMRDLKAQGWQQVRRQESDGDLKMVMQRKWQYTEPIDSAQIESGKPEE